MKWWESDRKIWEIKKERRIKKRRKWKINKELNEEEGENKEGFCNDVFEKI